MTSQEIELFDLPRKGTNACWSLNPWKTRLILNLKQIPYRTTWLEYPDVAPTLQRLGLPPNAEGALYTIPAIRLPDGRPVMDSRAIATELEALYPSPSLHLDAPVLAQVEALIPRAMMVSLRGVIMPRVPRNLLNPESVEYFERTREKRFGCSLAELERRTPEEEAWRVAEAGIRELGGLLESGREGKGKGEPGGPFFLGKELSYADLVVVGALEFLRCVEGRLFDRMVGMEPGLGRLYHACEPLLERKSY